MKLTSDDVKKIAHLARLELTDEEVSRFSGELTSILTYVEQLNTVDTTDVESTNHVTGLANVVRTDTAQPSPFAEAIIDSMPETEGRALKVKTVFDR